MGSSPVGIHLVSPDLVIAVQQAHVSPRREAHPFSETCCASGKEIQEPTFMGSVQVRAMGWFLLATTMFLS